MPSTWTSDRDAQLFYALIEDFKVTGKDLAAAWKAKYKTDKNPPTASAIDQHIAKLRMKDKAKGSGKTPTKTLSALPNSMKGTPQSSISTTPRMSTISKIPKTPTSGSRRKRGVGSEVEMSEDDESEPELSKAALANVGRRTSTPRCQKAARKVYKEDSSDDEADEEGETEVEGGAPDFKIPTSYGTNHDINNFLNFDGAAENRFSSPTGEMATKKRRMMEDDSDDESDVSDFGAGIE